MKKVFYTLLIAGCAFLTSCDKKNNAKGNVRISGNVEGFKQGKIYLNQIQDTVLVAIDSVIIDGKSDFKFGINLESPEMLYLTLDRGHTVSQDNQISFFAEPGDIEVKTTLKKFFADAKVSGSINQDAYKNYLTTRINITDRQNALLVDIFNSEKDNNLQKRDSLLKVSDKLTIRRYLNAVNFALNNKDKDVAPYIALTELYDANIKFLDTIYNSLSPEVAQHKYGKQLESFIKERRILDTELNK